MSNILQENIDDLGHRLKVKFKLPPDRPTSSEVLRIVRAIEGVPENLRTETKWRQIVSEHVNFEGHYVYEGLDNSDLNALQAQIMLLLG